MEVIPNCLVAFYSTTPYAQGAGVMGQGAWPRPWSRDREAVGSNPGSGSDLPLSLVSVSSPSEETKPRRCVCSAKDARTGKDPTATENKIVLWPNSVEIPPTSGIPSGWIARLRCSWLSSGKANLNFPYNTGISLYEFI